MIEVISGTNRPASSTLKIANIIVDIYTELGAQAQVLDLQAMPATIFDPEAYTQKPEGWSAFTDRVIDAKGLHVVTPEYNGSFPGVLKYFIDMLPFPASFEHRCVAFTGLAAGVWGGFRAVEQLQLVFGYRNAYVMPQRVWLPIISNRLDAQGKLTDKDDRIRLQDQAARFIDFIRRNQTQP